MDDFIDYTNCSIMGIHLKMGLMHFFLNLHVHKYNVYNNEVFIIFLYHIACFLQIIA